MTENINRFPVFAPRSTKIVIAHSFQKFDGLFHLAHAVHAIFDANPALVIDAFEDLENFVIIVRAFASDTMCQSLGITQCPVDLAHVFDLEPRFQIAVTRMHRLDAGLDGL